MGYLSVLKCPFPGIQSETLQGVDMISSGCIIETADQNFEISPSPGIIKGESDVKSSDITFIL